MMGAMLYHGYRLSWVQAPRIEDSLIRVTPRHSPRKVLAETPSISAAIDLIGIWESQLDLFAG